MDPFGCIDFPWQPCAACRDPGEPESRCLSAGEIYFLVLCFLLHNRTRRCWNKLLLYFSGQQGGMPTAGQSRAVFGGGGRASSRLGEADPEVQEMSARFPLKCKQNRIFLLWVGFSKHHKGHYIQTFLETAGKTSTPTHSASRHFLGFLWLSHLIQQTFIKISAIRQLVVNLYS